MAEGTLAHLPAPAILGQMVSNRGRTVLAASEEGPVLLIFLRHFGCTFCREALSDIALKRTTYEDAGVHLVFVHMADNREADQYFDKYHLSGVEHVSDPGCRYYAAMGLGKGTFSQLFGLQVMIRGFEAGVLQGHGIGRQIGDGFQMPGVFLIQNGLVRDQFIHRLASDRPDYGELVSCCTIQP